MSAAQIHPDPNGWSGHRDCHAGGRPDAVLDDQEVIRCRRTRRPDEATLVAAAEKLTQCDGYVVLAVDPQTGEVDAHGPFDGLTATIKADQLRRDFDRGGLEDVTVGVVRLHPPDPLPQPLIRCRRRAPAAAPTLGAVTTTVPAPGARAPRGDPTPRAAVPAAVLADVAAGRGRSLRTVPARPARASTRSVWNAARPRSPPAASRRAPSSGRSTWPISMIDLTTLEGADTPGKVRSLCAQARRPDPELPEVPPVAAVCVYPDLAGVAVEGLRGSPASGSPPWPPRSRPGGPRCAVKLADTALAVDAGATEIDMVIDRGAFLTGRYGAGVRRDRRRPAGVRSGIAHLKVILETGELGGYDDVRRASWLALLAGADVIKTSTGKISPAATLPVVQVMLQAVRDWHRTTGEHRGVKAAGGIRTAKDAIRHLVAVNEVAGPDVAHPRPVPVRGVRAARRPAAPAPHPARGPLRRAATTSEGRDGRAGVGVRPGAASPPRSRTCGPPTARSSTAEFVDGGGEPLKT